jgi:hypothetical protein
MKIDITSEYTYKFPFEKYCQYMIDIAPKSDIVGIKEIRLHSSFSYPKSDPDSMACYLGYGNGGEAIIEFHLGNLIAHRLYVYLLDSYHEIAGLLLSEILFHEIGHHVREFKRHNIKKNQNENFADRYAKAGYYHYLKSRKSDILLDYRTASWNIFRFNKKDRRIFSESRNDLIKWLNSNNGGIPFP